MLKPRAAHGRSSRNTVGGAASHGPASVLRPDLKEYEF